MDDHPIVGAVHRRGHAWVRCVYQPAVRRLAAGRRKTDRGLAARGHLMLGDVHDLNGAPTAAVRCYNKSLKLDAQRPDAWRSLGIAYENMGKWSEARHALMRAVKLAPHDELLSAHLERVEWAYLATDENRYPALYASGSERWAISELIARGHLRIAEKRLEGRHDLVAAQLRARICGARDDAGGVVEHWTAIGMMRGGIYLQHADWYYALQGQAAQQPTLWRVLLWKVRQRVTGGTLRVPQTLAELDVSDEKRLELLLRFQLATCEQDRRTLVGLAGKYPSWREPGETALRFE